MTNHVQSHDRVAKFSNDDKTIAHHVCSRTKIQRASLLAPCTLPHKAYLSPCNTFKRETDHSGLHYGGSSPSKIEFNLKSDQFSSTI